MSRLTIEDFNVEAHANDEIFKGFESLFIWFWVFKFNILEWVLRFWNFGCWEGVRPMRMGTLGVNKFFVIWMCICFQVFLLQAWLKGLSISCTSFLGTFRKLQKYGALKGDFIYLHRQGLMLWMFTFFVVGILSS